MAAQRDDFYITRQGQTWDEIAYEIYGDETYAGPLMHLNYDLLDIFIFSAGTVVYTPEIIEEIPEETPPWVEEDDGEGPDPYE